MRVPVKTQAHLCNVALFKQLVSDELERIAAGTCEVRVARGEMLFQKGDSCEGFYVVVYGHIKLAFTSPSGAEKVLELVGSGQSFGEALMFLDKPYPVYAQALADSMLLYIAKTTVFEQIARDPLLARRMMAGLSWRLHNLVVDLEAHTLRSAAQRVIGYLLRDVPDGDPKTPVVVALPTSKTVLASRLNLTPQHFSRVLHDLTMDGLIRVEGRSIAILDVEGLRRYEG